jgi:hypothetical protein
MLVLITLQDLQSSAFPGIKNSAASILLPRMFALLPSYPAFVEESPEAIYVTIFTTVRGNGRISVYMFVLICARIYGKWVSERIKCRATRTRLKEDKYGCIFR